MTDISIVGNEDQECLWIIKSEKPDSLIELTWDIKFANNDCKSTNNKVEVYDGLPEFISAPTTPTVSTEFVFYFIFKTFLPMSTQVTFHDFIFKNCKRFILVSD